MPATETVLTETITDADFDLFGSSGAVDLSGDIFCARTVESAPVTRPTRSKVALRQGADLT